MSILPIAVTPDDVDVFEEVLANPGFYFSPPPVGPFGTEEEATQAALEFIRANPDTYKMGG